jgi:hypothetical protein
MESMIQEMAEVLRCTEPMADQFAKRVQERVGEPVTYAEILAVMKRTSAKSLSMANVVTKMKREQKKARQV